MKEFRITYIFRLRQARPEVFDIRLDPNTLALLDKPSGDLPFWTRLAFQQCPHCLLDEKARAY